MIFLGKMFVWFNFGSLLLLIGANIANNTGLGWYEAIWITFGLVQFGVMSNLVAEASVHRKVLAQMPEENRKELEDLKLKA